MKIQIHLRIWMNLPSYLRINGLRSLVDKNIFLIGSIAIANEKGPGMDTEIRMK